MLRPLLELNSSDVKAMLKRLDQIEAKGASRFRKKLKNIADPIVKTIKLRIPEQPPLSGMGYLITRQSKRTQQITTVINRGRLNWLTQDTYDPPGKGMRKGPGAVGFSSAIKPSGRSLTTPIAKIILNSPALAMTDMAGRASSGKSGTRSREYTYRKRNGEIVRRRHTVNGQGRNMIEVLNSRLGRASRFGWAGLEKEIDTAAKEIDKLLQETLDEVFGRN